MINREPAIISGCMHPNLAHRISSQYGVEPLATSLGYHKDGDDHCQPLLDPFGRDVYVVQPTAKPAGEWFMELFIINDALKRAEARSVTDVIPYFGYGRQERRGGPFQPISGALMARFLEDSGANRVIWVNPHAKALEAAFRDTAIKTHNCLQLIVAYLLETNALVGYDKVCFAGTDFNATKDYAKLFPRFFPGSTLVSMAKDRFGDVETEVMFLLGDVEGALVIITDDMATTLTTAGNAIDVLFDKGAREVWIVVPHAVCVDGAWEKMLDPRITRVITTNTLPTRWHGGTEPIKDKFTLLDVAPLLVETIKTYDEDGPTPTEIGKVDYWRDRLNSGLILPVPPEENESPSLDLWDDLAPHLERVGINMDKKITDRM